MTLSDETKMLTGKIYDAGNAALAKRRQRAHELSQKYNALLESQTAERDEILDQLLPHRNGTAYFQGPIFFELGDNISFGDNFWANYNFQVLDNGKITIGHDVMIGLNGTLATSVHPMRWQDRNMTVANDGSLYAPEYTRPIMIGNNCWLASNVTVVGGVTIGDGCVIGAGSVVTHDIPANSFAAGVPAKVIRQITDADNIKDNPDLW